MASATLSQKAYRHLQHQLTYGSLLPGTVVSEKKLADELGISRTPVGQAVRQLVSEGLLEQVPRYGTVVKEITRQDILELYELREAMEPYAVRKAADRIIKPQLEQLSILCQSIDNLRDTMDSSGADVLEGEDLQEFLSADLAFHLFIIRAAANAKMLRILQRSRFVSQVFRIRRMLHSTAIVHTACEDHKQILDALKSADGEAAAEQMLDHIQRSKRDTLAFIDENQGSLISSRLDLEFDLSGELRDKLAQFDLHSNENELGRGEA